jgi:intracellular septation protein A
MAKASGLPAILLSLLWDVGLPVAAYFTLHWLGASDFTALLAGSLVALLRVLYLVVRTRRVDVLAAVMFVVFTLGLGLSFLTGDARFLLLKDSFATATAGLAFIGSCFVGRTLIYHGALRLKQGQPDELARFDTLWRTNVRFRRNFRVMSAVWGVGLLADAALRIPLIYALSVPAAVTASNVLFITTMVLLTLWTAWFARRIQTAAARQPSTAGA